MAYFFWFPTFSDFQYLTFSYLQHFLISFFFLFPSFCHFFTFYNFLLFLISFFYQFPIFQISYFFRFPIFPVFLLFPISYWSGLVWSDLVWSGAVLSCLVWSGLVCSVRCQLDVGYLINYRRDIKTITLSFRQWSW